MLPPFSFFPSILQLLSHLFPCLPLTQIFHLPSSLTVISPHCSHLFTLHSLQEGPWCCLLLPHFLLVCCLWCWSVLVYLVVVLLLMFVVSWAYCSLWLLPVWGFSLVLNTAFLLLCWNSLPDTRWRTSLSEPPFVRFLVSICPSSACFPGGGIAYSHCILWGDLRIYLR